MTQKTIIHATEEDINEAKSRNKWLENFTEEQQNKAIAEILWYQRNGIAAPTALIHEQLKRGQL